VRGDWLVGLIAPLPALIALLVFGAVETPDSGGYISYAEQLLAGPLPSGAALEAEAPAPVSLFRTIGYPALIAVFQALFGTGWKVALVFFQIVTHAALAVAAYRTAILLRLPRALALLAALLPSVGLGLVMQISILTDAVYAVLLGVAALLLVQAALRPAGGAPLIVGLLLAGAMLLREATLLVAVGFVPAVWIAARPGRRLRWFCLAFLPIIAVSACMAANNFARSGYPVVTTSRQVVMVQAVLPLIKQGLLVFDGDDLFDRTARDTLRGDDYTMINELNRKLFLAGLTAPEIAEEATRRYLRAWVRFPTAMLIAALGRYRDHYVALPFHPLNTIRYLAAYAGSPRPVLTTPLLLWENLKGGDIGAAAWLLIDVTTRLIGTLIGLFALVAPFLLMRRNDERGPALFGTWLICASCVAVYLPVHLDIRYLVPLIPLHCLLGATLWHAYGAQWRFGSSLRGVARLETGHVLSHQSAS
jgi:hypothetical protein